jgi:hypothetical protein
MRADRTTDHPTSMPASLPDAPTNDGDSVLRWIVRVGVAMCFLGHGCLGLFLCRPAVAAWPAYFAVVGVSHETALVLMPWVGAFDVLLALSVFIYPNRALLLWMTAWCIWTALLRPLAGESFWEAVERAGNYGAPLALFLMADRRGRWWQAATFCGKLSDSRRQMLGWVLRVTTVLLLLGHGMLNWIIRKPMFVAQYNLIGLPGAEAETVVGIFQCALALAVVLKPGPRLLIGVLVWKLASEALNPIAGSPFWVFVEHGGSYAAPLALGVLLARRKPSPASLPLSARSPVQ